MTTFAACSALLSGVRSLLEVFDTSVMAGGPAPVQARDALRKAALHIAQVRLLRSGRYASDLDKALTRLRYTPQGRGSDAPGGELSAALSSGLIAPAQWRASFGCASACSGSLPRSNRTAPPAGRKAWSATPSTPRWQGCAGAAVGASRSGGRPWRRALAATQVALLRALDPAATNGLDTRQFHLAVQTLPVPAGEAELRSWEGVRDLALAEWCDAHPLVGLLA